MRLSSNNLWLGGELQLCTWGRILCFRFSLNPLRFSLMRETDTKITIAKCWVIVNFYKKIILQLTIWQNWCFSQFHHPWIEVLQLAQILAPIFFLSVSLLRENVRGLSENLRHKIPTLMVTFAPGPTPWSWSDTVISGATVITISLHIRESKHIGRVWSLHYENKSIKLV